MRGPCSIYKMSSLSISAFSEGVKLLAFQAFRFCSFTCRWSPRLCGVAGVNLCNHPSGFVSNLVDVVLETVEGRLCRQCVRCFLRKDRRNEGCFYWAVMYVAAPKGSIDIEPAPGKRQPPEALHVIAARGQP